MPDSDRVSLIRWRRTVAGAPESQDVYLACYDDEPGTAVLHYLDGDWWHGEEPTEPPDWWTDLPADQGLTVGHLLELAQAGGAGWAAITGPNAASKLRAAVEQL